MFEKKIKCSTCGNRIPPNREAIYQVTEAFSLVDSLSKARKEYDAIDCPVCGCQNLLSVRMPRVYEANSNNVINDDIETGDEHETV